MVRIAGVNIPTNKRIMIALRYIHGIFGVGKKMRIQDNLKTNREFKITRVAVRKGGSGMSIVGGKTTIIDSQFGLQLGAFARKTMVANIRREAKARDIPVTVLDLGGSLVVNPIETGSRVIIEAVPMDKPYPLTVFTGTGNGKSSGQHLLREIWRSIKIEKNDTSPFSRPQDVIGQIRRDSKYLWLKHDVFNHVSVDGKNLGGDCPYSNIAVEACHTKTNNPSQCEYDQRSQFAKTVIVHWIGKRVKILECCRRHLFSNPSTPTRQGQKCVRQENRFTQAKSVGVSPALLKKRNNYGDDFGAHSDVSGKRRGLCVGHANTLDVSETEGFSGTATKSKCVKGTKRFKRFADRLAQRLFGSAKETLREVAAHFVKRSGCTYKQTRLDRKINECGGFRTRLYAVNSIHAVSSNLVSVISANCRLAITSTIEVLRKFGTRSLVRMEELVHTPHLNVGCANPLCFAFQKVGGANG